YTARRFTASDSSLRPVPFDMAATIQEQTRQPAEYAQLPDFSYALWDLVAGNDTCPLPGVGADAVACHTFTSHMGPVNSNHFLPQAERFYSYYHQLALTRARACKQLSDAAGARQGEFV